MVIQVILCAQKAHLMINYGALNGEFGSSFIISVLYLYGISLCH
jgi:hypothetical protein